jgi:uncharacterized membrane protein YfcA
MIFVFIYVCKKDKIQSKEIDYIPVSLLIGIILGTTSAFLGIGGGPANVAPYYHHGCL